MHFFHLKGCIFFPLPLFSTYIYAHVITVLLYVFAGDFSPSGARTLVLSKGVWFFPHLPGGAGSGPFSLSSIATIRAPAANLGLLAPLLANHLGSQDNQHEYISLHALNPLCPGLEPATAPLALAEVCVIRVNWAYNPLAH